MGLFGPDKHGICDRCGGPNFGHYMMSRFNFDCLCDKCLRAERKLPEYEAARKAETEAALAGVRDFPGVGLPEKITVEVTTEVTHRLSKTLDLTWDQWCDLVNDGIVPDLNSMYVECDTEQPISTDYAVAASDGSTLIDWSERG